MNIYKKNIGTHWCNLTLTWWFWATKVCLQVSIISKICRFGCPTGRATFWKANFENYSKYSLIKWYQFLSILYSTSNTLFCFGHTFLLSACSSESHATSCLSPMSHHWDNNKCNRVKAQHWSYVLSESTNTVLESFTNSTGKHLCWSLFSIKIIK